mmetsp:Transcript_15039/g.27267  ORF Transcript_15039/g.27267 Transcript_15039/m.27267 type:complete len:623 (-) Transcript_15039:350-2218(-)
MNQAEKCHQIEACAGLYIDGFKAFRRQTQDASCAFVLTHYHGDHYNGLPRNGNYEGPAHIHCTPVTAALLRTIHGVDDALVVEHAYGETWTFSSSSLSTNDSSSTSTSALHKESACTVDDADADVIADITFYDANHCPGAALVFIHLRASGLCHLHTGDMRYHPKMKTYPLLKAAVEDQTLDLVYLDTTYGHPNYEFIPQEDAVESIATQVSDILNHDTTVENSQSSKSCSKGEDGETGNNTTTLVLLSSYSIGKEKVLWEASIRSKQMVYVTDKKFKMLHCCLEEPNCNNDNDNDDDVEAFRQIIHRCTTDVTTSDLHVIPMGVAGELWPYFRPNFNECAKYAHALNHKRYQRVVAIVPTGWADGSKWNKKNAISTRTVDLNKIGLTLTDSNNSNDDAATIDVEIRLVGYSEHSAFSELRSFVQYLKPRKVIPTVFSNEKDFAAIEHRFRDLIDFKRATQLFVNSIKNNLTPANTKGTQSVMNSKHPNDVTELPKNGKVETTCLSSQDNSVIVIDCDESETDSIICTEKKQKVNWWSDTDLTTLTAMGFDESRARWALSMAHTVAQAIETILADNSAPTSTHACQESSNVSSSSVQNNVKHASANAIKEKGITHYFSPKKK